MGQAATSAMQYHNSLHERGDAFMLACRSVKPDRQIRVSGSVQALRQKNNMTEWRDSQCYVA